MNAKERSQIVLVTTTFSPSLADMRAQLALKTSERAREHGYNMIIVDGSPCLEFKDALAKTGAIVFNQQKPGMGQSRRECIKAGLSTGAEAIVWLEPEKHPLVPFIERLAKPVLSRGADVIIPRRKSLDGYPRYQQWSEYAGNWLLGNITNRPDLDFYVGPRVMTRQTAEIMASYDGKIDGKQAYGDNWEILFVPLLTILKVGLSIDSVLVDYVHPAEQLVEDDEAMRKKRDKQRIDLVAAMEAEARRIGWNSL